MVVKRFYLDATEYRDKFREILESDSERIDIPESPSNSEIKIYLLGKTNATLVYNGKNVIVMGAKSEGAITRSKSRLERITRVKLIEIK